MRHAAAIALSVITMLLLSGCAKPQYWIKGLTLPPGSTELNKTESTTTGNMPRVPFMGKITKMLMVSFKNPGGWEAVTKHIDACMAQAGYTESMNSMMQGMPAMPGEPGENPLDQMRMYEKSGSHYVVMLSNMGGMMDMAQTQAPGGYDMKKSMDAMGMGEFMLYVAQTEK